jgi:DNA-binding transcriptional LysR family regulator
LKSDPDLLQNFLEPDPKGPDASFRIDREPSNRLFRGTSDLETLKSAMELRHLRYFVAVAEELHFGHAAVRLGTSQPSLSQQIRNLEKELRVELFHRSRRKVELTAAGRRFLTEAREILSAAERAAALARETERTEIQKLVIGISPDTDWELLGRVIRAFHQKLSAVELSFQNLVAESQLKGLREGKLDAGFVGLPLTENGGLVAEVTARLPLVVAISSKHPKARRRNLTLRQLSEEPYAMWPRHLSPGQYDQILDVFQRAGFASPVTMEGDIPSARTLIGMVAAGLTIALVDPATRDIAPPGVRFFSPSDPQAFSESGVIYRKNDPSPALTAFLEEVRIAAPIAAERDGRAPKQVGRRAREA